MKNGIKIPLLTLNIHLATYIIAKDLFSNIVSIYRQNLFVEVKKYLFLINEIRYKEFCFLQSLHF
jgi:hypothetical protein